MPHSSLHSDAVLACSACGLMDVLANLAPCGRHGGLCTFLRAASRVTWLVFAPGCCLHIDSRVSLMGVLGLYRGQHGGVTSEQSSTPPGVAPQCWGWPHPGGGDGKYVLRSSRITMPSRSCLGSYTSRGCSHALSRGTTWGKDGSR